MRFIDWIETHEPARAALIRLTARCDREAEASEAARQRDLESCVYEPCRIPAECRTQILPGAHHARAAFAAGNEDEYINRMQGRYGGEW